MCRHTDIVVIKAIAHVMWSGIFFLYLGGGSKGFGLYHLCSRNPHDKTVNW